MKRFLSLFLALLLVFGLVSCGESDATLREEMQGLTETIAETFPEETDSPTLPPTETPTEPPTEAPTEPPIDEDGWYYSAKDVGLYIYTYGHLPSNYITKSEARKLGWSGGSVERYAPGYAIGGDRFGNREGLLPKAEGREFYECDIDTDGGKSRGAKRIVYTNDGYVFYTDDHYESFSQMYGEEQYDLRG